MKKLAVITAFFMCGWIASNAFAQDEIKAVQKGNFILDPYYGAPNFGKNLVKDLTFSNSSITSSGSGGVGPMGVRAEYLLADKFGLGVDFIFNSASMDLSYDSLNTDGSLYKTYNGIAKMQRIRIQLRFNYHFVSTENLDAYVGLGAGTNTRVWSVENTNPGYDFGKEQRVGSLIPFSMRFAAGVRYYFIPNLGFNAEIGLGGPLVSAGLSLKI